MSDSLNLKKSLFGGVKPAEVQNYIDTVSKDIEDKLILKDEEIEELKRENDTLKDQVKVLEFKLSKVDQEKERISEAFLKAENSANEIMTNAKQEAESLLTEAKMKASQLVQNAEKQAAEYQTKMEREFARNKMDLEAQKREIFVLRENVVRTLEKFDETLGKIVES